MNIVFLFLCIFTLRFSEVKKKEGSALQVKVAFTSKHTKKKKMRTTCSSTSLSLSQYDPETATVTENEP